MTVCYFVIIADNFIVNKRLIQNLAKRIKELRKTYGYTQDDLSFISGIERSTLGNIETAKNDITLSKVNKIAKAFKMSLSQFLDF